MLLLLEDLLALLDADCMNNQRLGNKQGIHRGGNKGDALGILKSGWVKRALFHPKLWLMLTWTTKASYFLRSLLLWLISVLPKIHKTGWYLQNLSTKIYFWLYQLIYQQEKFPEEKSCANKSKHCRNIFSLMERSRLS